MNATTANTLFNPQELEAFKNYLVFAKCLVDGYYIGRHRAPREGHAVEFSDYRPYVQNDDISRLDWRVYARTRQLVCRRHHAETDMSVHLFLDTSRSMAFASEGRPDKFTLGARICAAMAYLIIRQGDKVSWTNFSHTLLEHLPAGGTQRHLFELLNRLQDAKLEGQTDLAESLDRARPALKRRGRLVVISDFWCDMDGLFDSLNWYLHRKFEVLMLKLEDPWESNLVPGQRVRFVDMESGESVDADVAEILPAYRQAHSANTEDWRKLAQKKGIDTALLSTKNPYLQAIEAYMGWR